MALWRLGLLLVDLMPALLLLIRQVLQQDQQNQPLQLLVLHRRLLHRLDHLTQHLLNQQLNKMKGLSGDL